MSRRDLQFNIRIDSQAQLDRWKAAARDDGRTLSDWLRRLADAAAAEAAKRREAVIR